jgi:EmrB/QacA subfamily drug resistance transporter
VTPQRLTLLGSILGAFVVFLDAAIVNVALPAIERDLAASFATQQWVVNAYLVTLGSLLLVGGSLADALGKRRVFAAALLGFAATSLACGLAPSATALVVCRAAQGVAGAILTPASLALIIGAFDKAERGGAIGTWTAWTSMSFIVGPLVGGYLVETLSWRWVFLLNLPVALATLLIVVRMPRSLDARHDVPLDLVGGAAATLGLAGPVYALIEGPHRGWTAPTIAGPLVAGVALLGLFFVHERRAQHPMMPLGLFRERNFAAGNAATLFIYGGLSVNMFVLTLFLQQVAGYSPLQSGLATLPVTLILFFLSPRAGAWAARLGPRRLLTGGPLLAAVGVLLFLRIDAGASYVSEVLPGIVVFGIGLALLVAPLTTTVLSGIEEAHAGLASGINNAIARVAGLVAIAAVGAALAVHFDAGVDRRLDGAALAPETRAAVARARARPLSVEGAPAEIVPALTDASVDTLHLSAVLCALLLGAGGLVGLAVRGRGSS